MSSKAEAPANSERTAMTHITIEKEKLEQILEALEKHGVAPKDWACKECVPFSDILKDGFQCKYHKAITTCQQALAQPAVPLTDEQREEIAKGWRGRNWTVGDIIDAIEAAHGITEKGGAA